MNSAQENAIKAPYENAEAEAWKQHAYALKYGTKKEQASTRHAWQLAQAVAVAVDEALTAVKHGK